MKVNVIYVNKEAYALFRAREATSPSEDQKFMLQHGIVGLEEEGTMLVLQFKDDVSFGDFACGAFDEIERIRMNLVGKGS